MSESVPEPITYRITRVGFVAINNARGYVESRPISCSADLGPESLSRSMRCRFACVTAKHFHFRYLINNTEGARSIIPFCTKELVLEEALYWLPVRWGQQQMRT
jgi:hypothetical protein